MNRSHRTAAVLVLSAALVTLMPQTALAAPPLPIVNVWIDSWGGSWATLCGHGDVNDGATTIARWVFTVSGAVAEPFPVGPYVQVDDGDTFDLCDDFYVGSPPDAAFTMTLSFAGTRTDAGLVNTDVAGSALLVYEWNSVFGDDNQFQFGSNG